MSDPFKDLDQPVFLVPDEENWRKIKAYQDLANSVKRFERELGIEVRRLACCDVNSPIFRQGGMGLGEYGMTSAGEVDEYIESILEHRHSKV